ncbi:hypothetical protein GGP62_002194 [Salinibacter ruber]|nr:hypothetical protein [Salinibacter ruber]
MRLCFHMGLGGRFQSGIELGVGFS